MLVYLSQDPSGVADGDDIARQILRYDTARADDGIVSDGDTRENDDARTDPAVLPDVNGRIVLVALLSQFGEDRVSRGRKRNIRTEERGVTDINVRVIYKGEIKIRINVLPEMDMVPAPIGMKRRLDVTALADLSEHLL